MSKELFKLGINAVKRAVLVSHKMGSPEASAVAALSLIDGLDAAMDGNLEAATTDCFKSSYFIYMVIYQGLSDKLTKPSEHASKAEEAAKSGDFKTGCNCYIDAIKDIIKDTKYHQEFIGLKF